MTPAERSDQGNFYALTGEIIREWVKLELLLSLWLTDLLGIDEVRSRVVWNSYGDLRSKLNLLKTLVRNFADESLWDEARGIFAGSEKIAEDRYILAHTFGDVDATASRLTFISDKVDTNLIVDFVGAKTVDTDSVRAWLEDIGECQNKIREFRGKLGSRVHENSLAHRRQSRL